MKTITKTGLAVFVLLFAISCTKDSMHLPTADSIQTGDNRILQTAGHYIGERFGGGIIFLLDSAGIHGLIADTVDLLTATWWNGAMTATGATAASFGTGKSNTRKIISSQSMPGNYAALNCARSKRSGYTDWFLPSKDELNALYKQRNLVGGFKPDYYWSSTEANYNNTWDVDFYDGYLYRGWKANAYSVRAVRAF